MKDVKTINKDSIPHPSNTLPIIKTVVLPIEIPKVTIICPKAHNPF